MRRVSDCVSDRVFRSSRVYRELFVPIGARYQLDTIYSSAPTRTNNSAQTEEARKRARLTIRELDILTLVGDGLSAQQIARLRRISVRTVRKHLEHVCEKLEFHDRQLAVNKARQIGLLHSDEPALQGLAEYRNRNVRWVINSRKRELD
ncbi:MAG: response regulator transcription factor [Pseudonocardiaceae bacterium]